MVEKEWEKKIDRNREPEKIWKRKAVSERQWERDSDEQKERDNNINRFKGRFREKSSKWATVRERLIMTNRKCERKRKIEKDRQRNLIEKSSKGKTERERQIGEKER